MPARPVTHSYRVVYEIQGEGLPILTVIHGKRLLESVAERFDLP